MDPFEEFINLQEKFGNDKYMIGEGITQKEHALQAAYIAYTNKAPKDVVVGLLFHDVGQLAAREYKELQNKDEELIAKYLHEKHDILGSEWLERRGFSKMVQDISGYHTIAKIYLCDNDSSYYDSLSTAAKNSLAIQKINYNNTKFIQKLIKHPRFFELLASRICDDRAKNKDVTVPGFEFYRDMVEEDLNSENIVCEENILWVENIFKFK